MSDTITEQSSLDSIENPATQSVEQVDAFGLPVFEAPIEKVGCRRCAEGNTGAPSCN